MEFLESLLFLVERRQEMGAECSGQPEVSKHRNLDIESCSAE